MMVLAGVSWARFQRSKIGDFGLGPALWSTLARLIAIYYFIVLLYGVTKKKIFVSHLLLHSTFLGDWGGALNIYWFIESLIWCTVVAGLAYVAFNFEKVRRNPLTFTIALFVVAIALRFAGQLVLDAPAHRMRSPDQMLAYFAGGAILVDARIRGRLAVAVILVALSSLAWGLPSTHAIIMTVGCGLLVSRWRLLVPKAVHWAIRLVARNSFYIYIMQIVPMYLTDQILEAEHGRYWVLNIVVSIAVGLAVGGVLDHYDGRIRQIYDNLVTRSRIRDVFAGSRS